MYTSDLVLKVEHLLRRLKLKGSVRSKKQKIVIKLREFDGKAHESVVSGFMPDLHPYITLGFELCKLDPKRSRFDLDFYELTDDDE